MRRCYGYSSARTRCPWTDNRREIAKSHLELIKLPPTVIKLIHLFKSAQQQSSLAPNVRSKYFRFSARNWICSRLQCGIFIRMISILTFHAITAYETMSEGGHCVCCIQDVNKDRGSLLKPVLCQSGGKCTFPSSPYIPCKAVVFLILLIVKPRAVMNRQVRRMVMTHDNGEIVATHCAHMDVHNRIATLWIKVDVISDESIQIAHTGLART